MRSILNLKPNVFCLLAVRGFLHRLRHHLGRLGI
jgi:hypothetical protein